jgi:hypothetical protein
VLRPTPVARTASGIRTHSVLAGEIAPVLSITELVSVSVATHGKLWKIRTFFRG